MADHIITYYYGTICVEVLLEGNFYGVGEGERNIPSNHLILVSFLGHTAENAQYIKKRVLEKLKKSKHCESFFIGCPVSLTLAPAAICRHSP